MVPRHGSMTEIVTTPCGDKDILKTNKLGFLETNAKNEVNWQEILGPEKVGLLAREI